MSLAFVQDGVLGQYPVTLSWLRKKFPNTSFSKKLEGADLSEFGVVKVVVPPEPTYNPDTQYLRQADAPTLDSNGVCTLSWQVINYTDKELANQAANAAAGVRNQRNQLLRDSDWTQLPDAHPVHAAAWAPYRQALRDVTAQPGFPHNVTWPEEPKV